ncbi:MAG: right-handed parallel beta-helix repeat-containing protein [Candidatus Diapherotrites archaeon]
MKSIILLVLLVLILQVVTAQVIFEDDFDAFTQDYLCGSPELGHDCTGPPGYEVLKGSLNDASYGEPNAQIVAAGDRFGGVGNHRGLRFYLEARPPEPLIANDSLLKKILSEPEKAIYVRWYMRESFVDFTSSFQKLFRFGNSEGEQTFVPEWKYWRYSDPPEVQFNFWDSQNGNLMYTTFDLKTDVLPDSWHSYEIKIDLNNDEIEFWFDGESKGAFSDRDYSDYGNTQGINIGGNTYNIDWLEPVEETRDYDDVVVATEYIGPAECVDGDDISQSGACYCGGIPSPTDASNVYASGFCVGGTWQAELEQGGGKWICTPWSTCFTGTQTRTCHDHTDCGNEIGKPVESQTCSANNIYYVDKDSIGGTCLDSNPGTITQPWCTLRKASQTMVAGDITYIREGIYAPEWVQWARLTVDTLNSGTEGNPISYVAYPGEEVHITGEYSIIGAYDKEYITWDGFKISTTSTSAHAAVYFSAGANFGVIRNCEISGHQITAPSNHSGISIGSSSNIYVENCIITNVTSTADPLNSAGIKLYSGENIIVERSTFIGNGQGIHDKDDGANNTYRYNFFDSANRNFDLDALASNNPSENIRVHNNIFIDKGFAIRTNTELLPDQLVVNAKFFNNVFYGDLDSDTLIESVKYSPNLSIYNNIFPGYNQIIVGGAEGTPALMNNNCHSIGAIYVVGLYTPDYAQYAGLSEWQAGEGLDLDSIETSNALFVDPSNNDFRLQSNSPCKGIGINGEDSGVYPEGTVMQIGYLPATAQNPCTENWSCTAWSACTNGTQTRTCTDANGCGTTANKPPETQSCSVSQWQEYYIFGGSADDYPAGAYPQAGDNISRTTNNPAVGTHNLEFPATGAWLNANIFGLSIPTAELDWENSYLEFQISTSESASAEMPVGNGSSWPGAGFTTTGNGYNAVRINLTDIAATREDFGDIITDIFIGAGWPGTIVYLDEIKVVSPGQECRVNALAPCAISIAGGTIISCSLDNLQYGYDAAGSVNNIVSNLLSDTGYNIKIENLTTTTEQNISGNSNSAGTLEFSS